jgi:hypothetical protein
LLEHKNAISGCTVQDFCGLANTAMRASPRTPSNPPRDESSLWLLFGPSSLVPKNSLSSPLGGPLASFGTQDETEERDFEIYEDFQILTAKRFQNKLAAVMQDEKRYREFQKIMKVGSTHMSLKENLEHILREHVARELDEEMEEKRILGMGFGETS